MSKSCSNNIAGIALGCSSTIKQNVRLIAGGGHTFMENSGISWTGNTFNPWVGCTKVSAGCDHCYAESLSKWTGYAKWGAGAERRVTSDENWRKPIKWNGQAQEAGTRTKVFCASMADIFDSEAPAEARERLWDLIRTTPFLDWQILTKRPQNISKMLPPDWAEGWDNVDRKSVV